MPVIKFNLDPLDVQNIEDAEQIFVELFDKYSRAHHQIYSRCLSEQEIELEKLISGRIFVRN